MIQWCASFNMCYPWQHWTFRLWSDKTKWLKLKMCTLFKTWTNDVPVIYHQVLSVKYLIDEVWCSDGAMGSVPKPAASCWAAKHCQYLPKQDNTKVCRLVISGQCQWWPCAQCSAWCPCVRPVLGCSGVVKLRNHFSRGQHARNATTSILRTGLRCPTQPRVHVSK